jgi:glycosyltransferase involved in cell wall biosynthesis
MTSPIILSNSDQFELRAKTRILHLLGTLDAGGVETWLAQVWRSIDRERFQFDFCTLGTHKGLFAPEVENLGAKVWRCPIADRWAFHRRFRRIIRDGRYDVVHSHVQFFSGALLRLAKCENVRIRIAHSHSSQDDKAGTRFRQYYIALMKSWIRRYATCGLAASRIAAIELFGEHWEIDPRFKVLHCGIGLEGFQNIDSEKVREELGLPVRALVVGHVGSFIPPKNHKFILDVAQAVHRMRPDVHFLLVGDGTLRPEIEARAIAMGIADKIHFSGIRTDVPRLMRSCMNALVMPSLWEGLPMTLIEAQAAGLPCIASDSITEEAKVLPGRLTLLSLSAGTAKWAEQTIMALDGGTLDQGMASKAVAHSEFSIERSTSSLAQVYVGH